MLWSRWAWVAAAALGASGFGAAETGIRKPNRECPPGTVRPATPAWPADPKQPVDPKQPTTDPTAPADPLARAPEAGTQASESFNPNMYGDVFGGRGSAFAFTTSTSRPLAFVVSGIPGLGAPTQGPIPYRSVIGGGQSSQLQPPVGSVVFLSDNGGTVMFPAPRVRTVNAFQPVPLPPRTLFLQESPEFTAALRMLNQGTRVEFVPAGSKGFRPIIDAPVFELTESYLIHTSQTVAAFVPLPAGGGVVGRTKIAEDNNPMPRDRVMFNVDAFNNSPLTADGTDVIRYSPGFETTFADGWASFEARFPFASTLDPTQTIGGPTARSTVFGNIHLTLKGLFLRGEELNIAGGVGLDLPTGPDTELQTPTGISLFQVKNESYIVTPYVAALYTPDDRLFAQAWLQIGFDTSGSPVMFNPTGTAASDLGRLRDQTLLSADLQVGYWLLRYPPGAMMRGLAPFVELHYNTPISDAGRLSGPGLTVRPLVNRYEEVYLTLGFSALFADRMLVSAGFATPLSGNSDRSFDYQAGLRVSWYFGGPPPIAPMPGGLPAAVEAPEVRPPVVPPAAELPAPSNSREP